MILTREKPITGEKPCLFSTVSTINHTCTVHEIEPGTLLTAYAMTIPSHLLDTLPFFAGRALVKVKVKQSRYRPGVAQRVPGS